MCVRIPPNTDGGPRLLPFPCRSVFRFVPKTAAPWTLLRLQTAAAAVRSWGVVDVELRLEPRESSPSIRPTRSRTYKYMAAPALLFFPRFIPDILPPPRQRFVTLLPEIHSLRKKRERTHHQHAPVVHSHTPLNPPLPPLHPLTAVDSQQRTARTPSPPHTSLPQVDQHAGSAGQKPHDDNNILPLAHLPDQRPPLSQGPVTTDANTPATSPARRLSAEEDSSRAPIEPCTACGPTTEQSTSRHLALLHKSQQGHHSSPVRSPLLLGDLVSRLGSAITHSGKLRLLLSHLR